MKQIILSLILALATQFSFAVAPDSLKRDLEDYDYLVSFVEENYAPFDAIMQKGYKREYKALKKQIRKQLCEGDKDLEQAATSIHRISPQRYSFFQSRHIHTQKNWE